MEPEKSAGVSLSCSFMLAMRKVEVKLRKANPKAVVEASVWSQEAWLSSKGKREVVSKGVEYGEIVLRIFLVFKVEEAWAYL